MPIPADSFACISAIRSTSGRELSNGALPLLRSPRRSARALRRITLGLVSILGVAACSGGDGPVVIPPGFTAALSASTVSITVGSSATLTATIARTGTGGGAVSLSAEGLPAGLTVAFDPAVVSATTTSASITVSAAANTPIGTHGFTVRAKSAGLSDQVLSASVTVRAAPALSLTLAPSNATIQAGSSTQATVQLSRTEFPGAVDLSVTGLPAGATATFGTASLTGESTTLTIATAVTTTPGIYMVLVNGASTLGPRVAAFTLTLTAPPDFTVSAPDAAIVRQGLTTAPITATISRSGGFAAPVTLTFEGLPPGVTATPASLPVAGTSAQFTLSAASNATVGTSTITIRGKATGLPDRIATVALLVTADPGLFTISVGASASVVQGQSVNAPVSIVRTAPFTGAVTLTATGLPTGVTATFAPSTIAVGTTTSTVTFAVASTTLPGVYQVTVRGSGANVPDATGVISLTVAAQPSPLVTQHLLAQEGLAIALASTVLQSQLQILLAVTTVGQGSATICETLPGGGSVQSLPVGADNPSKAGIYYDAACTKPYILADVTQKTVSVGQATLTETATYYGPTGTLLGVMTLQETGQVNASPISVAGLGTFTPANGSQPVRLGLTCVFNEGAVTTAPCYGGIEQYVPSLGLSIGSVTPLTLTLGATANDQITFTGSNSVMRTGAQGSLTVSLNTPTSLAISGGTVWGTSTQQGSAASFSLFPPTPTGWTVTDAAHDMRFTINVVSNTVRNSVGQITQISTGAVLATIAVDQSGTGTITWSDGRTVAVTNWIFAD